MGPMMDKKTLYNIVQGFRAPYHGQVFKPINQIVVEYILVNEFGRGAGRRGKAQLIFGIIGSVISVLPFLLAPSIPTIIPSLIFLGVCIIIILVGRSNIRESNPNELRIANKKYCLKESFVTNYRYISDGDGEDTRIFKFTDGEEVHVSPGSNSDRAFYDYGKVGDRCFLLLFETFPKPVYVFDMRWWSLQPDLEGLTIRRKNSGINPGQR